MKQFIVTLRRTRLHENATIGQLFDAQTGLQIGVTLEDRDRDLQNGGVKIYGQTCIQPGQYKASRRYWDKVKRKVWGLWGVPKFEGILIHGGATVNDTLGCILLGNTWGIVAGKETLFGCKDALSRLDVLAANYDELVINVEYATPLTEDTRIK
jgi:Family of unknown function (DUF5675)